MIKDHNIFKKGRQGPQQTPVEFQLMVLLNFIGHESQTDAQQQNTSFIGHRTARLFRKCVVIALVLLQDQHIKWPDENERKKLGVEMMLWMEH